MNTRHVNFDDDGNCEGCPFLRVGEFNKNRAFCCAMSSGLGVEKARDTNSRGAMATPRRDCPLPVVIMPTEGKDKQ